MDSDLLDLVNAMRNADDADLSPLANIRRAGRAYATFGMRHPNQYALVFLGRRPHAPVEARALSMATRRRIAQYQPQCRFIMRAVARNVGSVALSLDLTSSTVGAASNLQADSRLFWFEGLI